MFKFKSSLFFIFVLCSMFYVSYSYANVVINEFQIEPTPQVVELFNKGTDSVDISSWYIDDSGGATYFTIPQGNIIYPSSCLSFTSDFNLNKTSSDTIRLFDSTAPPSSSSAILLDSFSYKASSGSAITFQRIPDGLPIWATAPASLNLFNLTGNSCLILPTSSPTLIPTLASTQAPTSIVQQQISYDNVYISEVMADPNSGEKEWLEIYNDNNFQVTLDNWYIDDLENSGSPVKVFSMVIPAKSYSVFELSSSIFNNDGDSVRLLDFNKLDKDGFEYETSEKGKSLGRIDFEDDSVCLQEPSKGFSNFPCLDTNSTDSVELGQAATPTSTVRNTASVTSITNQPTTLINGTTTNQQGEVLGTSLNNNHATMQQSNNLSRAFSFVSFSYSILTLLSILLKMKFSV